MKLKYFEKITASILLVIAGGMAIHTPVTLWLGTLAPDWALVIKAWKEVLMGIALVLIVIVAVRRKKFDELLQDRLLQLALVYAGLHFVMMMVFQNGLSTAGAGLLIDLRYILYFVLVYAFLRLYPGYRRSFIMAFGIGMTVILGFAVLQVTVLPADVLSHIGYSKSTIQPYLTVDQNPAFVRINSTLRGPNPLAAYAVIVAGIILAFAFRWKVDTRRGKWLAGAAAAGAGVAIGASYSRSGAIAMVVAALIVAFVAATPKIRKHLVIGGAVVLVAVGILLVAFRHSAIVSNVLLHDNPATTSTVDSNAQHADSVISGLARLIHQPLGAGVGSAGSASVIGDNPLVIENQYLLVAHEIGWAGLVLFMWLFIEVLRRLWVHRRSALALGVFASGIGLAVIGLLLPVWTDDTVSIVWWGLAAVAIAGNTTKVRHGKRAHN